MGERAPPAGRRTQLMSLLVLEKRAQEVTLDRGLLAWRSAEPQPRKGRESYAVPISEIIAVEEKEREAKRSHPGRWQKMAMPHAFTVYYVKRAHHHCWQCSELTFWCTDEHLCNQWICTLKELLDLQTSRPKHLLVYINPRSGKSQGGRVYEQKVAPLFSLASISTDVIVTEHANHAKDNLLEVHLEKYDGDAKVPEENEELKAKLGFLLAKHGLHNFLSLIATGKGGLLNSWRTQHVVCVGGDGMFSEVIHGLIGRSQKDSGIDQNNPKAQLVQCNIKIGIIPAGSTDCICYATVGINDPVTSALHIIVGDNQPLDVCSVHRNNTFLKYCVSLLGYGFYGDVLKDSEEKRWMGPARYDFSGFKTFFSHHYYAGTVSFLPAAHAIGSPRDKKPCRTGCRVCKQSKLQLGKEQKKKEKEIKRGEEGEWKVTRGKFLAINAVNISCACPRSPKGLSPAAHLADGSADLILVRKCSRFNFLRYLLRHTNHHDQFDFSFVEVYRIKKFRFTSKHFDDGDNDDQDMQKKHFGQFCRDHPACYCLPPSSTWNCDGETLDCSTIEVKVHCQLIKLFARGIENAKPESTYKQFT